MDVLYVAHKQKNEDRLFLQYCTSMSDMSFEEFKAKAGWNKVFGRHEHIPKKPEKEETEEEILAQVKDILG